jgi:hypothetical protein
MISKLLDLLGCKVTKNIEDKFFENYNEVQRLQNMRSVYTASTRPVKKGIGG